MLNRSYLLLFLLISCSFSLKAQGNAAEKFSIFFEKVYLHTDRELYLSGEDIWYKAYLVNAQNNRPFATSSNLYVELISPQAEIVSSQVIYLDQSTGKGDFKLSDTLPAGKYKLRAYTNWMRNFGDNFIFEKTVSIVKEAQPVIATTKEKKSSTLVEKTISVNVPENSNIPTIRFFPEGGSLIEGVSSRLAFKIGYSNGKGLAATGAIVSSTGDTITRFTSNEAGIGSFSLKPLAETSYKAFGLLEGKQSFEAKLPQALLSGFAMYVQDKDSLINIITFLNERTLAENQGKQMFLTIKKGGKTALATKLEVTSLQMFARISKEGLPAGINAITLYDVEGRPQCERLIFIPQKEKVNLTIVPDKEVYQPNERVNLTIKASDLEGKPLKAKLSLAVTDGSVIPENIGSIESYLLLESELRGKIENPRIYFDEKNIERQKQMELLLLTQGWRDFLWKRIADSTIRITRMQEQGITISGSTKETRKNAPLSGSNITLRTPNSKGQKLFSTRTDSLGRFYIDGLKWYGNQEVIVSSRDNKGEPWGRITLDSLFKDTPGVSKALTLPTTLEGSLDENTLIARKLIQRQRTYSLSDTIQLEAIEIKAKRKAMILMSGETVIDFGYPEEDFVITEKDHDYQSLLHYLQHRSRYSAVDIKSAANRLLFQGEKGPVAPIVILNGRQIGWGAIESLSSSAGNTSEGSSTESSAETGMPDPQELDDEYAAWTMDMIEKINIRKIIRTPVGGVGTVGYVITIITKKGVFDWAQKDKVVATLPGYYDSRVFYSAGAESETVKPDMRTIIYWAPNLSTNEKGEATVSYNNADLKSRIRIVAEGLSDGGIPLVETAFYDIK